MNPAAPSLALTPLHGWHVAHDARMVDFAGWSMPIQYQSIVTEHLATRHGVGLFDISHMGRLAIGGPDGGQLLDYLLTRSVLDMRPGQIRYALMCNEQGGILDDVLVYRNAASADHSFSLVVNGANRDKILTWLEHHQQNWRPEGQDTAAVEIRDDTLESAMLAVQGPAAIELVDPLVTCDLAGMRYYHGIATEFEGRPCYLSRTGYTGEDGCEIICPAHEAETIWERLVEVGQPLGATAAGLGARDTLRLEAAMPLYGHELSEETNPVTAGLRFAITMNDRPYIGRQAVQRFAADPTQMLRVGLHIEDRRVARQGVIIWHGADRVGHVTSGTHSPTLQRPIAMAYICPKAAALGAQLTADIRGKRVPAVVVPLPFYERPR